jgi:catechol 2,3-dioxygenase-like lactoylglutathione lyase family enzyme
MASIGGRDTRDFVVWTGVDASQLLKESLQDGTNLLTVTNLLSGALNGIAAEVANDPAYASVWSIADSPIVSYRMGTAFSFENRSEYSRPNRSRAEVEGHMLPLLSYDLGLGWTWDYLRNAYTAQVEADIQSTVDAARKLVRTRLLGRIVARTDDSGAAKGLGSSGYSPGFATTAASTNVDFTPPEFAGVTFASTHEHYAAGATSLTSANAIVAMKHLREHGHQGPFDLWISVADEATIRAFSDFVSASDPLVTPGSTTALVALPAGYIGYLSGSYARVRVMPGMPTSYWFMFKSYGANNAMNPIRVRVGRGENALRFVAFPDPNQGASPANPLGTLIVWSELGVGVGDRTNGALRYNDTSWTDGTAS